MNSTTWIAPNIMCVRPVESVTMLTMKVSTSITRSLPLRPRTSGRSNAIEATATTGIVSPILASADPSARFMLVCSRSARAARTAANVSGSSTRIAMMIPITAFGAPATATARSIEGEIVLANPTTATSDNTMSPKLAHASATEGGVACSSGSA